MKVDKREFSFRDDSIQKDYHDIVDQIYAIVTLNLEGLNKRDIYEIIENPRNEDVRALIIRFEGKAVGFVLVQLMYVKIDAKLTSVFRSMAGIHPEFRRRIELSHYAMTVVLKHKLRFPRRPIYCFGVMASPAAYFILHRAFSEIYPTCWGETPERYKTVMLNLAEICGYTVVNSERLTGAFQRRSNAVRSLESQDTRNFWRSHRSDYVTDFINRTGYAPGVGVLTLIPFTWRNLFFTLLKKFNVSQVRAVRESLS